MTVLMFTLVALLLAGTPGNPAYASCNAIPERPLMFYSLLERGSIDRAFVSPDPDQKVTLRFQRSEGRNPAVSDFVIRITFKPPLETSKTFYIAGNDNCEPLEELHPICSLKRLFCSPPKTCFAGSAVGLTTKVGSDGMQLLRFHFPETGAAGPVQISAARSDQGGLKDLTADLSTQTCAQIARGFAPTAVPVCIDQLQPIPNAENPQRPADPPLIALTFFNDYQALCTPDASDGTSTDPQCTGAAADISFTLDANGDVLLPVRWDNILRPRSSGGFDQRNVLGSTIIEAVLGKGKRINIPGAIFLETAPPTGGIFTPSPVFVPTVHPKRPNEQTFVGTADQPWSVLRFSRRKQWGFTCGNTANSPACDPMSGAQDCPSSVQCAASAPGYFLCDGGDNTGNPCTRSAHCPNGGVCRRISDIASGVQCYGFDGKPTGTKCKQDSECGASAECGPGLFEFRNRQVNGIVKVKRVVTNTSGVCDGGSNVGNLCTKASACPSANCVSFRADAWPYPAPTPTL